MAKHQTANIRNVAIVGHSAVGKTTLADLLLFKTKVATRAGSVDDGSSLLDVDEDEQAHKHSISSSVCHFTHDGKHVNVIDTPGKPDFIGQVIGSLRAVETAVITVAAPSGIEVNTRRTFNQAVKAGVGRMILINKCDADNIDFEQLISDLQEMFGAGCVPLNLPVGLGGDFKAVHSTLSSDVAPNGVVGDASEYNQNLMDAIAESDEELMERYLEGEELTADEIESGLHKAIAAGSLVPIFCCSAKTDVGVDEFLSALSHYAPSPVELTRKGVKEGEEFEIEPKADGPLIAQVFKTRIDPFVAKMNYIRVYSGTLSKDASVNSTGSDKPVKISQLLEVQGGTQEAVDAAVPGDIVATVKLEELQTGNVLTRGIDGVTMPPIVFPKPMIALAVEPKSQADQSKISGALAKIIDEDPTFEVERNDQTRQMVMRGMSELHLKISEEKLNTRDKVEIVTSSPKIPYRETVSGTAEGSYRHKKQSGGAGQFAEVHFRIAPIPQEINEEEFFTKANFESMREYHYNPELNYAFVDRVTGGSVPNNYIPAVEKGIKERMTQGVIAGNQVQDVSCELFFGKDHPVDSNETAFKTAASMCFRDVFKQASPVLLEPICNVEITVPGDNLGDITSDLNTRRGRVEGMDGAPGGYQIIHAKVPLAEMMTYSRNLGSMTGGQGSFTLEFSHYETVPPQEQQKIVAAAAREAEEEG